MTRRERQAYQTAYQAAHQEGLRTYHAAHYAANRDEQLAQRAANYAAQPAIAYRYNNLDGSCAYVGSGTPRRANEHPRKSQWWTSDMTLILSEPQPTLAHARLLEWQWFIEFQPIHNKDGYQR